MDGKFRKVRLLDMAQFELDEAIEFYNYENLGLGDAFFGRVFERLGSDKRFSGSVATLFQANKKMSNPTLSI